MAFEYVFVHGFRDTSPSYIGSHLKQTLQDKIADLHVLDATRGRGYEDAKLSEFLDALDAYYEEKQKPMRLIGISMGALISAIYASRHPSRVDKVVLLSPAVDLEEMWPVIADRDDPSALDRWRDEGVKEFLVFEAPSPRTAKIPFSFVEDSLQLPSYPDVPCPSVVVVGKQDLYVPPKYGYALQSKQTNSDQMRVIEVDDGHDLLAEHAQEKLKEEIVSFFGL